jgi:hypothetical protein
VIPKQWCASSYDQEAAMRVNDLRTILEDMKNVLAASGEKRTGEALGQVASALQHVGDKPLGEFIAALTADVNSMALPLAEKYSIRLKAARLEEGPFMSVWNELSGDDRLKKADLQRICILFVGQVDKKATTAQLKTDIKRAFFTRLYDRDAQAMANRATPW